MPLVPGLQLPFGIQPVNPVAVDAWSGPYTGVVDTVQSAIDAANASIPSAIRFKSMEVRLIVGGTSRKFWYRDGILDTDLVEFIGGTGGYSGGDTYFYISGSTDGTNRSVFGGDVFVSGSVFSPSFSGSLTTLIDGSPYLIAGSNIVLVTGSNGSITISSTGGGGTGDITEVLTGNGLLGGGTSGSVTLEIDDSVVATVSGATFNGVVNFVSGLSGSLTSLIDGTPYLIAGSNVTISTGSNGSITISSTGGGSGGDISSVTAGNGLLGGGTSGDVTLEINDSVVATVSGATFTGTVNFNSGLSGSLTRLTDGSPFLVGGTNVTVNTNNNGSWTISSTGAGTNSLTFTKWMETPSGDIDGMNMVYTLEDVPAPQSSLLLYVNGVLQKGDGEDYALSGDTFVMNYAPLAGSSILATYTYQIVLPSGPTVQWFETPTGIVDGFNNVFTLLYSPDPPSALMLHVNGILQRQGPFEDYTLIGNTITLNYVPQAGSRLTATYAYTIQLPEVGKDIAWMENPGGLLDGSNSSFTLSNVPYPSGSLMFYVNGVLQRQGPMYDYVMPASASISMNYMPESGSVAAATYPYDKSLVTGDRPKYYANVLYFVSADSDVSFVDGNIDSQLPDMSKNSFLHDYDVYINGALLRPGINQLTTNDYYPGTSLSSGKLKFRFNISPGDVICVVPVVL